MQKGYFIEWNYTVVEMDVCDVAMIGESEKIYMPITEDRINMVHKKVEGLLHNFSKEAVLLEEKNKFILIFVNHSEEKVVKFMKEVRQRLLPFLRKNETFFIGIGRATKSIRCVSKSFGMATKIIKMLQLENKEMEIYSNKEMGVYRLLLAIGDRETMLDYIADTIEPLREYDALNNENLTEVLQKYMEHNGNIKEIAEEMFVHRNTINYKLKKIENILHAELRDWHICQQLEIGFRLEKIIKMYHV